MNKKVKNLILLITLSFSFSCNQFFEILKFSPKHKIFEITFTETPTAIKYEFIYSDTANNEYLRKLRTNYQIDSLVEQADSEIEKVKLILNWTRNQWEHDGMNRPNNRDPISILEEVKRGENFRCLEYGIVCSAALSSIGLKARVIGLKTKDVEDVLYAAGHVASEVWLNDYHKWVFVDPQFNVIPFKDNIPLNSVEFQKAILDHPEKIEFICQDSDFKDEQKQSYIKFIGKYLYYFDTKFDNRVGLDINRMNYNGRGSLMLVPIGAEEPTVFQRNYSICTNYTNNLNEFYHIPN